MAKQSRNPNPPNPKIPRSLGTPAKSKIPRAVTVPFDQYPEFKAEQMDSDGKWGWNKFESSFVQEVMQRIFEAQKLTWQDHRDSGSHPVKVVDLIHEAQKRLVQIEKDDVDELYSFRISGKKRIWGIREGNILWIL